MAREARRRLQAIRERENYPAIMAALLAEARSMLPTAEVVRVDPRDEPLARRLLDGDPRVEPVLLCARGITVADGCGASVPNTVEERFTAAEPDLHAGRPVAGRAEDGQAATGDRAGPVPAAWAARDRMA